MNETELVKACLDILHELGILAWRQNTGAVAAEHKGRRRYVRFGVPGISDILGVMPGGRFLAVECKVARNPLTPKQREFLDEINRIGGLGIVARDVDDVLIQLGMEGLTCGQKKA